MATVVPKYSPHKHSIANVVKSYLIETLEEHIFKYTFIIGGKLKKPFADIPIGEEVIFSFDEIRSNLSVEYRVDGVEVKRHFYFQLKALEC